MTDLTKVLGDFLNTSIYMHGFKKIYRQSRKMDNLSPLEGLFCSINIPIPMQNNLLISKDYRYTDFCISKCNL